ncbi:MAG: hypothetical protein QXP17_00640 [Candidatus Jordarchaeales archaeon]
MSAIEELAKALVEGDRKKAIEIARTTLEGAQIKDKWVELAWKGWLVGLERLSRSSLIAVLVNGISAEEARGFAKYLESLAETFFANVPQKAGFVKGYLKSWIDLLNLYASLKESKK